MPDQTPSPTRLDAQKEASPPQTAEPVPTASAANPDTPANGDTQGIGTVIALGCIGATLFLIVLGLVYIGVTQLFG